MVLGSRWPLWRVEKLSSFLRTSPTHITSDFVLFYFSSSSRSCTCSSFSNFLTLWIQCMLRSSVAPLCVVVRRDPEILSTSLYVVSADPNHLLGFRGLPFRAGQCGLEAMHGQDNKTLTLLFPFTVTNELIFSSICVHSMLGSGSYQAHSRNIWSKHYIIWARDECPNKSDHRVHERVTRRMLNGVTLYFTRGPFFGKRNLFRGMPTIAIFADFQLQ